MVLNEGDYNLDFLSFPGSNSRATNIDHEKNSFWVFSNNKIKLVDQLI